MYSLVALSIFFPSPGNWSSPCWNAFPNIPWRYFPWDSSKRLAWTLSCVSTFLSSLLKLTVRVSSLYSPLEPALFPPISLVVSRPLIILLSISFWVMFDCSANLALDHSLSYLSKKAWLPSSFAAPFKSTFPSGSK